MSQKKTCDGCGGLLNITGGYSCRLGYPVKTKCFETGTFAGHIRSIFPLVPCPKPTTKADYIEASKTLTFAQTEGAKG